MSARRGWSRRSGEQCILLALTSKSSYQSYTDQMPFVTRLAPSPTGALHLGNARTFLVNWALARSQGWRIVLRIEDLDGPRIKPEAVTGIVKTLQWLGMDWDSGRSSNPPTLHPIPKRWRSSLDTAWPTPAT